MPSAFVLGSCVTRDCLKLPGEKDLSCSDYFARTSLVSLNAPPRPLGSTPFEAPNNFARKAILRDFDKSFFDTLDSAEFDIFVVDFVDERFSLLKHKGSVFTQSHEMERSGLIAKMDFEPLGRFKPEVDALWK